MVSVLAVPGCGQSTCPECTRGVAQICTTGEHYGIGDHGSFAPYVAIREWAAVKLPAGISPAAGAVATDAVMTAYQAVARRGNVKKGDTVLLMGLGGLGFNALQIILSIGARAIVVDNRQTVLDEAVRFGVKEQDVVPVGTADVAEWVRSNKLSIDTVIDFVGVPETFQAALSAGKSASHLFRFPGIADVDPQSALRELSSWSASSIPICPSTRLFRFPSNSTSCAATEARTLTWKNLWT